MKQFLKRLTTPSLILFYMLVGTIAAIAGSGTYTIKDSTNTTQTFDVTTDGSGNYVPLSVIADGTAAANKMAVDANSAAKVNQAEVGGTAVVADPCQANAKLTAPISQTSSGTVITGTSAKKNYVCSVALFASAAMQLSLVEYSGTCTGGTPVALLGSTTAANGIPLAANGGIAFGSGVASVMNGSTNAYNVCLLQNGTGTAAGTIEYVQQ